MDYSLSSHPNNNKIFILQLSEIEKRLDPLYYFENVFGFLKITKYNSHTLSELTNYTIAGFGVGKDEQDLTQNGYIQIRPTNIDDFGLLKFDRNVYLGEEYITSRRSNIIQKNDILFNNTNSQELVGKTAFFDLDGTYFHSNHITRINVNEEKILPKFLWILLNLYQQKKIFYTLCTNWNNQSGVGLELLNSLKIIVPEKAIQQKVIDIHENSFWLKRQNEIETEKLLESIDEYLMKELGIHIVVMKHSLKERIFSSTLTKVTGNRLDCYYYLNEDIEIKINNGSYNTVRFSILINSLINGFDFRDYKEKGTPYIKVANVRKGEFDFTKIQYIEQPASEISKAIQLQKDNILLTRKGTYGFALCLEKDFDYVISSEIFYIEIKHEKVYSKYLESFFNSVIGQKQFDRVKIGAIMGSLSQEAVKSLRIPLPRLPKQKEIADHITSIRQQIQALKDKTKEILARANKEIEQILIE